METSEPVNLLPIYQHLREYCCQQKLKEAVRNPNYRGISATFWRNLAMVGNLDTFQVMGTPYCGKGEPNQVIEVGHASPACLFRQVDVFGGM